MKNPQKKKVLLRSLRHKRVRAIVSGTEKRPRLSVFRSHKHLSVQLIDDVHQRTLLAMSDRAKELMEIQERKARAFELGKMVAVRAKEKGITSVVFDRGGYTYHGNVQAIADGARQGGLQF